MALVRYQSPDDSSFLVFDRSRFRLDHGLFLLTSNTLRDQLLASLATQSGWNLEWMKLVHENKRIAACVEWLETLPADDDAVATPGLSHEPAIDLVANRLIADRSYVRVICPACSQDFPPSEITVEPWAFEEDGTTIRGRRSLCPGGHTLHVTTDEVEVPDLEVED